MIEYDPKKIEAKWQKRFEEAEVGKASEKKDSKKSYLLVEFPYPSGAGLHTGHVRSYTAMDIIARKRRRQGESVLYPIGWDAFGLPTENYAIKTGRKPADITRENTDTFRRQLKSLGISFDWSREVNTTDPNYYKWTQWIFLQLYKNGLAYKAKTTINWCPKDKIGLANEEVVDGACERCGTPVEKREKEQWMLAITKYAKRLYDDLDTVDYIERAKIQQRNWIGPSEGAEIDFEISNTKKHFIFIHGFHSGALKSAFWKWMHHELEMRGHTVEAHDLPNADDPTPMEQVEFIIKNCTFQENTIIVGHSLGSVVAMKVAEQKKIRKLVLVGAFMEPSYKEGKTYPYDKKFDWNFDWTTIRQNTGEIVVLSDLNDPTIPLEQGRKIAKKLECELIETEAAAPHFKGDVEPVVLRECLSAVTVFTTRPDTLFGATFLVLSPEHRLVTTLSYANKEEVAEYVKEASKRTEIERTAESKEKTGVELVGVKAINPASHEEIPIFVADYVLSTYGTGAIMAVPAHDGRDFAFSEKHNIPVRQVIDGGDSIPYVGQGPLINSDQFNGLNSLEAKKKITEFVHGKPIVRFKLRDWVFSRQRYWGEPIPMIWCANCGWQPVDDSSLPVTLPEVESYSYTDTGESPLANLHDWVNTTCPKCKGPGKRETDTMPNWAGSSWYYLRYADPQNSKEFASKDALNYWVGRQQSETAFYNHGGVDWYNGGMEHTVLHLLYSRFWHKFLFDIGLVPTSEPYAKRTSHGLILAEGGEKMSKSKGNTVSPDEIVERFGADSLRVYEMFMGPFEQAVAWSTDGLVGAKRFLERVLAMKERVGESVMSKELETLMHETIRKITGDVEELKMNTAISALMIFSNELHAQKVVPKTGYLTLISLLQPFAPHICEEIWESLGNQKMLSEEVWPTFDEAVIQQGTVTISVQINGKLRGTFSAPRGLDQEKALNEAMKLPSVTKWLDKKPPRRLIYIPDRMLNIVL